MNTREPETTSRLGLSALLIVQSRYRRLAGAYPVT